MQKDHKADDILDRLEWLKQLREAIPKAADQVTPRTLEIWAPRLVRIPMETLFVVANVLVERHIFFPALAEILTACRELKQRDQEFEWKRKLEGWKQERALAAGDNVTALERRKGA
jgi:hypothetical protein